jgi:acetyl esterase/lipase
MNKSICAVWVMVVLCLGGISVGGPAYDRKEDVIYGRKDGMALTLDVITPKEKRNGVGLVLMMSGGWISAHEMIVPQSIEGFMGELISREYTVFAVVHGSQPRYTIPDAVSDVNRAVRFIKFHAKEYGIDPDRLGVYGGSAGGHLSCMMGAAPLAEDAKSADPVNRVSSKVAAVAAFFPPTDFLNYGKEGENAIGRGVLSPFKAAFDFRKIDAKTGRYVQITDEKEIERITEEVSPIYHVDKDDAPTLIIHGDADTLVPIQQAKTFLDNLKEAGVETKLVVVPGGGHGFTDLPKHMKTIGDWFDLQLLKKTGATTR